MSNRAKKKILEKIDSQIKYIVANTTLLIILAINKSRSPEIDDIDIQDALEGSILFNMIFDKTEGKVVHMYLSRKKGSISDQSEGGRIVQ